MGAATGQDVNEEKDARSPALVTGWSQGQPPMQPGGILVPVPVSVPSWGRECEDFLLPSPAHGQDLTGASLPARHAPSFPQKGDRQLDNSLLGTRSG